MDDARTDERVEIAAEGIHARAYGDNGTSHTRSESESDAAAAIAALEAAGWEIVKKRENHGPVHPLIIDAPAVEEAEPEACERCGHGEDEHDPPKPCAASVATRCIHVACLCSEFLAAPAGTECPTCGGNGEFLDALAKGADRYVPCPTCSPNETSER